MSTHDLCGKCSIQIGPVGFDLDMTLIDSRQGVLAAFKILAEETSTPIELEDVRARLGLKLEYELSHWFPASEIASAAAIFRRHYVELARSTTQAMPGAHQALAAVASEGAATVIITAKHEVSIKPCLEATGLRADQIVPSVHGPEKARALEMIGASVYLGDTPDDMMAARDAGVVGVGLPTGEFGPTALVGAGASVVLESLREFPSWYRSVVRQKGSTPLNRCRAARP
jgi:phosphoglycolate phosphatase-like HAD superfamily hydrolase